MSYLSAVENKNISSYYIADIHQGSGEDYYQMQNTEEAAHFPYFPIFAISVLILSDYYPCNAPTPSYITSSYFIIYPDTGEGGGRTEAFLFSIDYFTPFLGMLYLAQAHCQLICRLCRLEIKIWRFPEL